MLKESIGKRFCNKNKAHRKEYTMAKWLDNAIFYEIYPQSFLDTNGDGIGDFQGIIENWIILRSWDAMRSG